MGKESDHEFFTFTDGEGESAYLESSIASIVVGSQPTGGPGGPGQIAICLCLISSRLGQLHWHIGIFIGVYIYLINLVNQTKPRFETD